MAEKWRNMCKSSAFIWMEKMRPNLYHKLYDNARTLPFLFYGIAMLGDVNSVTELLNTFRAVMLYSFNNRNPIGAGAKNDHIRTFGISTIQYFIRDKKVLINR